MRKFLSFRSHREHSIDSESKSNGTVEDLVQCDEEVEDSDNVDNEDDDVEEDNVDSFNESPAAVPLQPTEVVHAISQIPLPSSFTFLGIIRGYASIATQSAIDAIDELMRFMFKSTEAVENNIPQLKHAIELPTTEYQFNRRSISDDDRRIISEFFNFSAEHNSNNVDNIDEYIRDNYSSLDAQCNVHIDNSFKPLLDVAIDTTFQQVKTHMLKIHESMKTEVSNIYSLCDTSRKFHTDLMNFIRSYSSDSIQYLENDIEKNIRHIIESHRDNSDLFMQQNAGVRSKKVTLLQTYAPYDLLYAALQSTKDDWYKFYIYFFIKNIDAIQGLNNMKKIEICSNMAKWVIERHKKYLSE